MFEKERESLKRQGKWVWFLLVPVVCIGSYCVCGIGAAVAIPGFVDFTRQSKATEATSNLATLAAAMEEWCEPGGMGASRGFPPSAGPIPSAPGEDRQAFIASGTFVELAFVPGDVYYSYTIETLSHDQTTIVAEGDLDGDGIRSRYMVECLAEPDGCHCDDEPTVQDALE